MKLKLIYSIFIMFLSMFMVNAGTVVFNQDDVITELSTITQSSLMYFDVVGSVNSEDLGNVTTGDLKLEFQSLEREQYFKLNNNVAGTQIILSWQFSDESGIVHQNLTLEEVGEYYFKIKNDYSGEGASVMISVLENSTKLPLYVISTQNEGLNSVFAPLINGVVDLITINISIWTIIYYLFITLIVLSAIGFVVLLGFKYYNWTKEHNIYGKHNNSRR